MMKNFRTNSKMKRGVSLAAASVFLLTELLSPMTAAAAPAKASVEETMYLNLDYYGQVSKANVVKGISFNSLPSYTDYGNYTDIINMSTEQKPVKNGDSVTWEAPKNGGKFFFQGTLEPERAVMPWHFDVSYKLNGVETNAEDIAGASGLVEMDIDAFPNRSASKYMQDNFMLIVAVPIDSNKVYSVDAPGSQMATLGQYSGVMFMGLPGKEEHFVIRMGTDSFETVGAVMMMSPGTVGDLSDLKDLKDLKDKFRNNTNTMLDSVEALMDNVTDMSEQLELNNQMLRELRSGKDKISSAKDSIFAGNDVLISDLRELSGELGPLDESLRTTQWMIYDLNKDLNGMDQDILDMSAKMRTLSTRLKALGNSMGGVDNLTAQELAGELAAVQPGLAKLQNGVRRGQSAAGELNTIFKSGAVQQSVDRSLASASEIVTQAAVDNANYEEEYLPEAVIEAVNLGLRQQLAAAGKHSLAELSAAEMDTMLGDTLTGQVAGLLAVYDGMAAVPGVGKIERDALIAAAEAAAAGGTPVPGKYQNLAGRYVGRLRSLSALKRSSETLRQSGTAAAAPIAGRLSELSGSLSEIGAGLSDLLGSGAGEALLRQLSAVSSDIRKISEDGAAVSFQTARFLNSTRALAGDMDTLISTLDEYYPDVQKLVGNTDALVQTLQKSSNDLAGTLKIVNDTARAASDNLDHAAEAGLDAGELAVGNAGRMIENTRNLKDAGADLRKSINDELDEKEAENNFLNMDPDAVKLSFTSEKNEEPSSLAIVARTEEISVEDDAAELQDAEDAEAKTTPLHRIAQVFVRIWQLLSGLFHRED